MSKVTAPQDAHGRLVLQVYLGSNTLEFSAKRPCNMLCLQIDMLLSSSTIMVREAGLTKKGVDKG